MNRRRVIQVLGVAIAGAMAPGLAACGARAPELTTDPTASKIRPSEIRPSEIRPSASSAPGVTLAAMGLAHGPATVTLPNDLTPVRVIDQPNVVTLIIRPADATRVQGHLEATLRAEGFTVDARSQDSLLFHDAVWDGAWTSSDELAGITFRRRT